MSTKDLRFYRNCPICNDKLAGTDDGLEVYNSIKQQMSDPDVSHTEMCCTLCGESCNLSMASLILKAGEPKLYEV